MVENETAANIEDLISSLSQKRFVAPIIEPREDILSKIIRQQREEAARRYNNCCSVIVFIGVDPGNMHLRLRADDELIQVGGLVAIVLGGCSAADAHRVAARIYGEKVDSVREYSRRPSAERLKSELQGLWSYLEGRRSPSPLGDG